MTFVKGVTTWADLASKITALACGEVADDFGVTVVAGDRWRRFAAGQPTIAAPASKEVTIAQEHRAGYWDRTDDTGMFVDAQATAGAYIRSTNTISSASSGIWGTSKKKAMVTIAIDTANTTANNYSTLVGTIKVVAYDNVGLAYISNTPITFLANGTGIHTVSSGGVTWTISIGVGSTNGFIPVGAAFQRDFTPEYPGGIDNWNGFGKAFGSETFSTAPSGISETDYSVVKIQSSAFSVPANPSYYAGLRYPTSRSNGLGIKTQAGLSGNRYAVSFGLTEAIGSFVYRASAGRNPSVTFSGNTLMFSWGGTSVDGEGLRNFGNGGNGVGNGINFVQPFSVASASGTAFLEYWLSVSPSHITLSVNGDVASSGVFSINQIAEITPPIGETPILPNWYVGNLTSGTNRNYLRLGRHPLIDAYSVKGVRDGGRDWQTGFGRSDFYSVISGQDYFNIGGFSGELVNDSLNYSLSEDQYYQGSITDPLPQSTNRSITNYITGNWSFLGLNLLSIYYPGAETAPGLQRPQGTVNHGLLKVPTGGFASGDELTDTLTGKKYMLWVNGYSMVGVGGNLWGIAQEER